MKNKFLNIVFLGTAVIFTACNNSKKVSEEQTAIEVTDTIETEPATPTAPVASPSLQIDHKDGDTIEITGEVISINQGKDGYTAMLKTAEDKIYAATISIPNLDDPRQYKASKVGDKLTVKGIVTNLESDVLIRVKELR